MKYEDYIWSPRWFEKSAMFLSGRRECMICKKRTKLHTHHLHYKNLGNESSKDLIAVCKKCHNKIHKNSLKGNDVIWNFVNTRCGKNVYEV